MKLKTTKKEIRGGFYRILSIGYCDAQYLLRYKNPFGYSAGVYGWACDYYDIDGVCISTGYQPLSDKNMLHDYNLVREYENKARDICTGDSSHDGKKEKVNALLSELIDNLTPKEGA